MSLGDPIPKSHVNAHSGLPEPAGATVEDHEIERRVQAILNAWCKGYFSGVPVTMVSKGPNGEASYTFPNAHLLWNQDEYPDEVPGGVIHWALTSVNEERHDRRAGYSGYWGEMFWNVLIRVTSQEDLGSHAPGPRSSRRAEFLCRGLAADLKWLLQGPEARRLAASGISKLRVVRGPVVLPGGREFLRQLVVSHRYFYEIDVSD